MPHEACFDSFEAEMLEPCGLSAIWVLSTFSGVNHEFRTSLRMRFDIGIIYGLKLGSKHI